MHNLFCMFSTATTRHWLGEVHRTSRKSQSQSARCQGKQQPEPPPQKSTTTTTTTTTNLTDWLTDWVQKATATDTALPHCRHHHPPSLCTHLFAVKHYNHATLQSPCKAASDADRHRPASSSQSSVVIKHNLYRGAPVLALQFSSLAHPGGTPTGSSSLDSSGEDGCLQRRVLRNWKEVTTRYALLRGDIIYRSG